jgi:hypothetical protein
MTMMSTDIDDDIIINNDGLRSACLMKKRMQQSNLLITISTSSEMALTKAQETHLLWVLGSMVPMDMPTTTHPETCLG